MEWLYEHDIKPGSIPYAHETWASIMPCVKPEYECCPIIFNIAKLFGKLNRGIIVAFLHLLNQMYLEKWEGHPVDNIYPRKQEIRIFISCQPASPQMCEQWGIHFKQLRTWAQHIHLNKDKQMRTSFIIISSSLQAENKILYFIPVL